MLKQLHTLYILCCYVTALLSRRLFRYGNLCNTPSYGFIIRMRTMGIKEEVQQGKPVLIKGSASRWIFALQNHVQSLVFYKAYINVCASMLKVHTDL